MSLSPLIDLPAFNGPPTDTTTGTTKGSGTVGPAGTAVFKQPVATGTPDTTHRSPTARAPEAVTQERTTTTTYTSTATTTTTTTTTPVQETTQVSSTTTRQPATTATTRSGSTRAALATVNTGNTSVDFFFFSRSVKQRLGLTILRDFPCRSFRVGLFAQLDLRMCAPAEPGEPQRQYEAETE